MKRTWISIVVLAVGVALAAWGLQRIEAAAPDPPRVETPQPKIISVRTQILQSRAPQRTFRAQGRLVERQRSQMICEEGGRLTWVLPQWRSGLEVQAGQDLWKVGDEDLQLQGKLIEAQRASALAQKAAAKWAGQRSERLAALERERMAILKGEERRWQLLTETGQGNQSALDMARAQTLGSKRILLEAEEGVRGAEIEGQKVDALLLELNAQADLLGQRIERLEGKAPLAGFLQAGPPSVGEWILTGAPLGTVVSNLPPRVVFEVPEGALGLLRLGDSVDVHWAGQVSNPQLATLASIGNEVEARTGELQVEADLVGATLPWRPGMSVQVDMRSDLPQGLWILPGHVLWQRGTPGCFVFEPTSMGKDSLGADQAVNKSDAPRNTSSKSGMTAPAKASWRPLVLGPEVQGLYPILEGLAPQEKLIGAPLGQLFDGAPVREEVPPSAPASSDDSSSSGEALK